MSHYLQESQSIVQLFKKYVFTPFQTRNIPTNDDQLQHIAIEIYNWARNNGAQYISLLAYPMRNQPIQKHYTFLSLKFIKENLLQSIGLEQLKFNSIWKDEIDGSCIPNGGLRQNHQSRATLLWDHLSQLFIRKRNSVLYIPSFIITPQGNPIDDRLHFRKTQIMFEKQIGRLLKKFKINFKEIFLSVNLGQQFFIIPKQCAQKRLDLKYTNRALIGKHLFHSSENLYHLKKIPDQVLKVLKQAQNQLLQLGVPIKMRHHEGAPNQFEIGSQGQNAMLAIDHNVLTMQILKQTCQRNGLCVLFHEKPFYNFRGSGKHINWAISYLDQEQKLQNLYNIKSDHQQLLTILLLTTIKAIQQNHKLFIASTMTPGNQLRIGHKSAPLPAMSVYLGQQASHLVEGLQLPQSSNLKQKINVLLKNQSSDVGDRNRTTTISYSQNRFQFRLPGSSQNVTFPITVIMASVLNEVRIILNKLDSGQSVSQIISQYRQYTRLVRYEGDGLSEEWKQQAQKRGLFNPKKTIVQRIKNIKSQCKILTENQIYTNRQIQSKYKIMRAEYMNTVKLERQCILKIINTNIIPRSYSFISTFPRQLHLKNIENRMRKFDKLLQQLVGKTQELQNTQIDNQQLNSAYKMRQQIFKISELTDRLLDLLPQSDSFPQINQFLHKWQPI